MAAGSHAAHPALTTTRCHERAQHQDNVPTHAVVIAQRLSPDHHRQSKEELKSHEDVLLSDNRWMCAQLARAPCA